MRRLLRTCLPAALVLGLSMPASWAEAGPEPSAACKSKRASKKKPKRVRRAKRSVKRKVTARTIARWQKKRMRDDKIVEKAMAAGYRVTKAEKRRLRKYRVRKPLIAKLEAAQKPAPVVEEAPKVPVFDLDKTMDPNDIDFDSVPPPKGMPTDLAKKQREEAERKPAPAPVPAKTDDKKTKRVVIAAGK